jgi:hypothetical protein
LRGVAPKGHPHSPWQILEHLRLAQLDILDFCRNSKYVWPSSMEEYWPPSAAPPSAKAWRESIAAFRRERRELKKLAANKALDLFARIPHGTGQTYLRAPLPGHLEVAYLQGRKRTVASSSSSTRARACSVDWTSSSVVPSDSEKRTEQ